MQMLLGKPRRGSEPERFDAQVNCHPERQGIKLGLHVVASKSVFGPGGIAYVDGCIDQLNCSRPQVWSSCAPLLLLGEQGKAVGSSEGTQQWGAFRHSSLSECCRGQTCSLQPPRRMSRRTWALAMVIV
jgi:hypothetical protein